MKRLLLKSWIVLALVALLVPAAGFGDEMAFQKRVAPGISFITYNGQVLRFATPVTLSVTLETLTSSTIHLAFVAPAPPPGGHVPLSEYQITVYWVNFSTSVYEGVPPVGEPWEGTLNTEGGFVDR